MSDFQSLPTDLPAPEDDGAAAHLPGLELPIIRLAATDGRRVDLSALSGKAVVYVYPRTGLPGTALPDGWDAIPGARGCTPQTCAFVGVRPRRAMVVMTVAGAIRGCQSAERGYDSMVATTTFNSATNVERSWLAVVCRISRSIDQ